MQCGADHGSMWPAILVYDLVLCLALLLLIEP